MNHARCSTRRHSRLEASGAGGALGRTVRAVTRNKRVDGEVRLGEDGEALDGGGDQRIVALGEEADLGADVPVGAILADDQPKQAATSR